MDNFGFIFWAFGIFLQLDGLHGSKQESKFQSAFNPSNPFIYRVPPVVSFVINHPAIKNKTHIEANNGPYNSTSNITQIGEYKFHTAKQCGVHFLNLYEGFILSDKMFGNQAKPPRCSWGFVGSQFCTPSIQCPKFHVHTRNSDCRMNYLQISDSGQSFAQHFCDSKHSPDPKREYIAAGGVLDITFRYASLAKRPEFECHVKCVQYPVNFTTSIGPNNETLVEVLPLTDGTVEEYIPKQRILKDCKCGTPNNSSTAQITKSSGNSSTKTSHRLNRILGGRETLIGQYPWMAGLVHHGKLLPFCGASLISDRYESYKFILVIVLSELTNVPFPIQVLTAAHCLDDEDIQDFVVVLNEHDFLSTNETAGNTVIRRASEMIPFPYYLESTFYGDMALIHLERPVDISKFMTAPICLPLNDNKSYVGYEAIGAGWGTLQENGKKSPKLHEVLLKVFSNEACNDYHSSSNSEPLQVTDNMMCAGFHEGGRDTCSGDSGGPLVAFDDERFRFIGVTSWGFGCGNPRNPGIFSRVSSFLHWIRLQTVDSIWCQDIITY